MRNLDDTFRQRLTQIYADRGYDDSITKLHSIYAHGRLHKLFRYDTIGIKNTDIHLIWIMLWAKEDNFKVSVTSEFGECVLYFWRVGATGRGLVCLKDDVEACEDAERKCVEMKVVI